MAEPQHKKIAIIIGSSRPKRIGPKVATFIRTILESSLSPLPTAPHTTFTLTVLAIADFGLPVFDEDVVPMLVPSQGSYAHTHTKAWSEAIAPFDGYILVTPSYNGGPPGGVKNAIDFLYNEWVGKEMFLIGYGIDGGMRANRSLRTTFEDALHMTVVKTVPELLFPGVIGPAMYAALGGVLTDECLVEWEKQKGEILKGFAELKEVVVAHKPYKLDY